MPHTTKLEKLSKATAITLCLCSMICPSANAGGFELHNESVTYLGNAYAGTCSAAQDGSTAYSNPAAMIELKGKQIVAGYTHEHHMIKVYNQYATDSGNNIVRGNEPSYPHANLSMPTGHMAWHVHKDWALGVSVVEPFGLYTEYGGRDISRFMALKTRIKTLDISPSIAYRLNPMVDIGASLDFLRSNTIFDQGVESTGFGAEANGFVFINSKNKWRLGYHVGVLIKPDTETNIGIVYFSRFDTKFNSNVLNKSASLFYNSTQAAYTIRLPDHLNFGITHKYNQKWTFMAEGEWTHWRRMNNIVFVYNSQAVPGIKTLNYKNTWRASLGTDYNFNKYLTLKAGLGFDQSPTVDYFREAMMPDSDRYIVGIGAKVTINKWIAFNAGYAHTFYRRTYLNESAANDALNVQASIPNQASLTANVKQMSDTLGLQVVISFN